MINRMISPHMVRQAEILLARSAHWSRGTARTADGLLVNIVTFASSRQRADGQMVVYGTRVDGAWCSCPGFQSRQACSHAVACKMEAERAREAVTYKRSYRDLYPPDEFDTVSAF